MPKHARRRTKHVLLPSDQQIKAKRAELPQFEPYATAQLLARARALVREHGLDLDTAVVQVRDAEWKAQAEQLLKALGEEWDGEPEQTNWQRGFIKLASLYHGAARFAHQMTPRHANARTWTLDDEVTLLFEVGRLRQEGYSQRQAIEKACNDFAFPHREQTPGRRAKSAQRYPAAVQRHLQPLVEDARTVSNPLARALGQDQSAFETVLWLLTEPPIGSDKRKSKKSSV
jgi:hypothetical protein